MKINRWVVLTAFILAFLFRLAFGVLAPPNRSGNDQQQTYLIGLKAYTTQTWPYFGPDAIEFVNNAQIQGQIPGALQGVLISSALKLWPDPLSPYIVLNLLTFGGFLLFGWYSVKRIPGLSPWFIYAWLFFAPWDTHLSTQVFNLSFAAFGSLLFFVGFMEGTPVLTGRLLPPGIANALMGFSFFWIVQFHLSWVLFAGLILISFFIQVKTQKRLSGLVYFLAGSIPTFVFLLPTYLKYGFHIASDSSGLLVHFNLSNFLSFFTILARFFSFACFEVPRWVGDHTQDRIAFLLSAPWLMPPCLFLLVVGWAQALALFLFWFKNDGQDKDWRPVKILTLAVFLTVWGSFWFTARQPDAHRFYLIFPFVFYYSFYCWRFLAAGVFWRKFSLVLILAAVFFQAGYIAYYAPLHRSNYLLDREKISRAIEAKDYRLLAERWPLSLY